MTLPLPSPTPHRLSARLRRWSCLASILTLAACAAPPPPPAETDPTEPIADSPSVDPATPSFHDFRPSLHGFRFRNGFQGRIAGTGENSYGLCGGMSFAAADLFLARRPIPPDTAPPADGTPLHRYLFTRQSASFGTLGAMGLKFVEWMHLPDDGPDGAHARTLAALPAITRALSRGEPVILGLVLVRADGRAKAWDNHQVLALSAESDGSSIRIYDPNFPRRDDITITIRHQGDSTTIRQHIPGRPDIPVRGFFRMPYTPAVPPATPQ